MKHLLITLSSVFIFCSAQSQTPKKDSLKSKYNYTYKGAKNKQDTIDIYNQIILSAQDSILQTPLSDFIGWLSERVTNKEFQSAPLLRLHEYFLRTKLQEFVNKYKIFIPSN